MDVRNSRGERDYEGLQHMDRIRHEHIREHARTRAARATELRPDVGLGDLRERGRKWNDYGGSFDRRSDEDHDSTTAPGAIEIWDGLSEAEIATHAQTNHRRSPGSSAVPLWLLIPCRRQAARASGAAPAPDGHEEECNSHPKEGGRTNLGQPPPEQPG